MSGTAFITGITGQDGSYLAELLLQKGYIVCGMIRNSTNKEYPNIKHIKGRLHLYEGDLLDVRSIENILHKHNFTEVYHLAAQSNVGTSYEQPVATYQYNAIGTQHVLDAVRTIAPHARLYNAATSELFGNSVDHPQNEHTPLRPRSPYAISKLDAYWNTIYHREAYGMYAVNGILFNHESPRRGENFVTRKVTKAVANILYNKQHSLHLGNIKTFRDWGFAGDYVRAMWLMLQQQEPQDFVIATGKTHSVEYFVKKAFEIAGLNADQYVISDHALYRPSDVHYLSGDASEAKKKLKWEPTVEIDDLIEMMVTHDITEVHNAFKERQIAKSYQGKHTA